jgi:hypothetical protein
MIKLGVKFKQVAGRSCFQFQLMYLSWSQEKYGMAGYFIICEIDLMLTTTLIYGQHKVEIMSVQVLYQVTTLDDMLNTPDLKPFCIGWVLLMFV